MLLVVVASLIGSFATVALKSGAARLAFNVKGLLLNWRLAAGVIAFLLSSLFFLAAIKKGELSVLYPLVSLGYVWTLLWSRIFFKEAFSRNKFIGLGLIMLGISLLGLGSQR
jgi:multidrug transporter EmrE-like cation transporter